MTCRHSKGDPNCSSTVGGHAWQAEQDYSARMRTELAEKKQKELLSRTPNPEVFEIIKHQQIGKHLILQIKYSSCSKCSFDSQKVMVFLNTPLESVLYWKVIDPHFKETLPKDRKVAPPPRARFPADSQGWEDAITFATGKK